MTELHVLRVFTSPDGDHGNPLGVFLEGSQVPEDARQGTAHELGYSETVFVDEISEPGARIQIYTPGTQLRFAGHPTVGTSWLLRREGHAIDHLVVPAGEVATWQDGHLAWIRARAEWVHHMTVHQYATAAEVGALSGPPQGETSYYAWAWLDETKGLLRSRYFAGGLGVPEDEATGAAAVVMGDRLGRPLTIHQGRGSQLHVRPGPDGTVEIGGRVVLDMRRSIAG